MFARLGIRVIVHEARMKYMGVLPSPSNLHGGCLSKRYPRG
jgi:hypothetical protein